MMELESARIGWASYSPDFSTAGDRRRLAAYARMRGLAYERARLDRDYDVVLLTYAGDIPGWLAKRRRGGGRPAIVFELIDSYLTQTGLLKRHAKGVGRFVEGKDSRLAPDVLKTLRRACREADAVLCSTLEQQEEIARLGGRAFVSFDWFGDELGPPKTNHVRGDRLKLVWEGQAATVSNLQQIREPLNAMKDKVELHVVTDPSLPRYLSRFGRRPALDVLQGILCPIVLHPWQRDSFSRLITDADAAVIPIDGGDAMMRGKPENKLVLLWKLGMPVLAGPSPAYRRAMADAGLTMLCESDADWRGQFERLLAMPADELKQLGERGRAHAEKVYSAEAFCAPFDEAFAAAGLRPQATQ
jgi:glycosyltransferase involved in cell wall biosynthesis